MQVLLGKNIDELKAIVKELGLPAFAAKQLAQWIYQRGASSFDEMTNLSKAAREKLKETYSVGRSEALDVQRSVDGTAKYLFPVSATRDGEPQFVETVFIPDGERATVCVSCQVGCKMRCAFCMTGRQGFHGQLTAADILNQLYSLPERERITNVVFMGQGEPMDNLDNVLRATQMLCADYGWAWSPKRITVSTVGLKKGVERFLNESQCHLAVSLHNPFPDERSEMMPAEKAWSLTDLMQLLRQYDWTHQRRLSFEYTVMHGHNDSPRHVRELCRLLNRLECRVNLIRCHELPDSPFQPASESTMEWMRDELNRRGITCTIRASRGQDIFAACGLLSTAKQSEENPSGMQK
ncbi:MAG: 23S rRNA (adenine(2503)-C(2))-methyltransferase RlmN [Bacteroidales bacterium]|nr:23S rRNA (adenine(2503)-C(2))-methyltransferase RlmN [Candidatus Physcousia equi]